LLTGMWEWVLLTFKWSYIDTDEIVDSLFELDDIYSEIGDKWCDIVKQWLILMIGMNSWWIVSMNAWISWYSLTFDLPLSLSFHCIFPLF
jgi:hypothetical protein